MYQAIVFLPLLGALIAGLIALLGAHQRHPGGEPASAPRLIITRRPRCMPSRRCGGRRRRRGRHACPRSRRRRARCPSGGNHHLRLPGRLRAAVVDRVLHRRLRRRKGLPHPGLQLVLVGHARRRLGAAHRHADRGHAGRGQHRVGARAHLLDRLHGARPAPAALLRLSVAVHLRDADAGDRRQPRPDVLRLGRASASPPIC